MKSITESSEQKEWTSLLQQRDFGNPPHMEEHHLEVLHMQSIFIIKIMLVWGLSLGQNCRFSDNGSIKDDCDKSFVKSLLGESLSHLSVAVVLRER